MFTVEKIFTQNTGIIWYPLLLVAIFLLLICILWIWGRYYFRNDYNKNTAQVKPFNSGNLDEINYTIRSGNLYWGFKKALESYFTFIESLHKGDLNDYMVWLFLSIGVVLLLVSGGLL